MNPTPSPSGNQGPQDRIWSDPYGDRPALKPSDPRHHNLVHDLDVAWDLPIPYALPSAPTGVQPRVEFTAGPVHPVNRARFTDEVIAREIHAAALELGEPCACGTGGVR